MNQKNLDLAIQLRHALHKHPEISNNETWTKEYLISFLKEHTNLEIIDKGKWFYAIYIAKESQKNIAFRADFDALPMMEKIEISYASEFPGVAHKCGHDGHSATLAAFALEIDEIGANKNIFFLFQHAEETGDGAIECAELINEYKIEEIFAYHNISGMAYKSVNIIDKTVNYASKGMQIHMEGFPTHASYPELGRNPAFAIAQIINNIQTLISEDKNKGMILCTIIQVDIGERAFGVSASKGDLLLTIRALYEDDLEKLKNNLQDLSIKLAKDYELSVNFSYYDSFPETSNHKESSDKIRNVCKKKGITLVEMKEAVRFSEDFGHYLKKTRGAICYIGNGENYPPLHTLDYDFRDEIIEVAVELFTGLASL